MSNTKLKEISGVVILAVFALFLIGYKEANFYLPIIYKISDPSLYPNDLLSSAISSGTYDVSFFFVALAFISKYVNEKYSMEWERNEFNLRECV